MIKTSQLHELLDLREENKHVAEGSLQVAAEFSVSLFDDGRRYLGDVKISRQQLPVAALAALEEIGTKKYRDACAQLAAAGIEVDSDDDDDDDED